MKKLSLLILIVCNVTQLTFADDDDQSNPSNAIGGSGQMGIVPPPQVTSPPTPVVSVPPTPAPPTPGTSALATVGSVSTGTTSQPSQGRRSSGRQFSPLKPLRTQSGSMPGFIQRAAARNSGPAAARGFEFGSSTAGSPRTGRSVSGRSIVSNQPSLQQTFLNNAMLFDANSDRQLAANELKNLFILLVSENIQNTQNHYYGFGNGFGNRFVGGVQYGQSGLRRGRSTGNQNFVNQSRVAQLPTIGFLVSDAIPSIQSSSMQEAILLFLLLTLQFDVDGDGALDRAEIQRFATALLNNELNLNQAAVQAQRRR
ncbi:MAG: hypothetical protein ABJZ55_20790 [Fuerstiella sp.]